MSKDKKDRGWQYDIAKAHKRAQIAEAFNPSKPKDKQKEEPKPFQTSDRDYIPGEFDRTTDTGDLVIMVVIVLFLLGLLVALAAIAVYLEPYIS